MAGFQGYADLDAAIRNGQVDRYDFLTNTSNSGGPAGVIFSSWYNTSTPPAGSTPSSGGTQYSGPNNGAITFNNVSPKQRFLKSLTLSIPSGGIGVLVLYDRLCATSGISLASAATTAITTPALPRYTNGVGVQAWAEFTAGAVGAPTLHCTYTNQAGTPGQVGASATSHSGTTGVGWSYPFPLADGSSDSGVQSVQSVTVDVASSGGSTSVVLLKPLATITMPQVPATNNNNIIVSRDFVMDLTSLTRIYDGANLCFMFWPEASGTTTQFAGSIETVYS